MSAATAVLPRPRSLGARIALIALAVYVVYAATQMDLSLERAREGMGHAARFFARLFPPDFTRHELLVKGLWKACRSPCWLRCSASCSRFPSASSPRAT